MAERITFLAVSQHALIRARGRFPQISHLNDQMLRGVLRGVFFNSTQQESVVVGHAVHTGKLRDGTVVRMTTAKGNAPGERVILTVFTEGMDIPEERA